MFCLLFQLGLCQTWKGAAWYWRDGSTLKSPSCSSKGPVPSTHFQTGSQTHITPTPEALPCSSDLCKNPHTSGIPSHKTHTYKHITSKTKANISFFKATNLKNKILLYLLLPQTSPYRYLPLQGQIVSIPSIGYLMFLFIWVDDYVFLIPGSAAIYYYWTY